MVYQPGQKLLYGVHGVCTVVGIEQRKVDRKLVEYYCLSPVDRSSSNFYIPTGNPAALSKLRPIMTKSELEELMRSVKQAPCVWIADENRRKQHYRDLMSSLDRQTMLTTVGALVRHKNAQLAAGKKLHLCDENFLRDAQKLIAGEFSLVLGIEKDAVQQYIQNALE